MLTPKPMEPDWPDICSTGDSSRSGYTRIKMNHPEKSARRVVTTSHSVTKKKGNMKGKFCVSQTSDRTVSLVYFAGVSITPPAFHTTAACGRVT